jgi:hypothetical protein
LFLSWPARGFCLTAIYAEVLANDHLLACFEKFLVGLLADLVADQDFVILALMQALAVTRVMKPLNLVLKSPGEKPTRNVFNLALTQQVAAVPLMNMPILVWSFAKTSRSARCSDFPYRL